LKRGGSTRHLEAEGDLLGHGRLIGCWYNNGANRKEAVAQERDADVITRQIVVKVEDLVEAFVFVRAVAT